MILVMSRTSLFLLVCCFLPSLSGQEAGFIEGRVIDKDTRDPLPAYILAEDGRGSSADNQGRFKLPIRLRPGESQKITVWLVGFKKKELEVKSGDFLTVELEIEPLAVQEISVTADSVVSDDKNRKTVTLTKMDTYTLPGTAADPVYSSHVLPGVNSLPDSASLLVRGGAPDEVGYFLDGIEIRHPFLSESLHESYFSIFDNQVVDNVSVATSGFQPKHGDALSGIMEISVKDSPAKGEGGFGLSVLGLNSYLGLPLKGIGAFVGSFDLGASGLLTWLNGREGRAFGNQQFFGKLILRLGGSNQLRVYGLADSYRYAQKGEFDIDSRNRMAAVSWTSSLSRNFVTKTLAAVTHYDVEFDQPANFQVRTGDDAFQARTEVMWDLGRHFLEFGADLEARRLTTDWREDRPLTFQARGTRLGFYANDKFRLTDHIYMNVGSRASSLDLLNRRWDFDPRASLAFLLTRNDIFRFSAGAYHQFGDYYVLRQNRGLEPKSALHAALSYDRIADTLEMRATLYDKEYRNLFLGTSGGLISGGGRGYARGGEFFLKKKAGRYEFLLVYNALRSKRRENDSPTLSPSPYEIIHSATAIVKRTLRKGSVGLRYSFATGRPYTPLEGRAWDDDGQDCRPVWGAPYSARYPAYQRLDLNGNFSLSMFNRLVILYFGVTNLLNNKNILRYDYSDQYASRREQSSIFGRTVFLGFYLPFF